MVNLQYNVGIQRNPDKKAYVLSGTKKGQSWVGQLYSDSFSCKAKGILAKE
jgi:hypothetical protein